MSGPVPCPSCGQPVPAGRLACPSCGALVASVSRAVPDVSVTPVPDANVDAGGDAGGGEPALARSSEPAQGQEPEPGQEPDRASEPLAETETRPAAVPTPSIQVDEALAADGIASGGIVPGSYLPPSTVHRPSPGLPGGGYATPPPVTPGGPATWAPPAAPAATGAWIPPAPAPVAPAAAGAPSPAAGASAPGRERRAPTPGRASILADLPFDAPEQLEGWLVALGGGIGVLGFFLPWTGAIEGGLEGYLGSWGLGVASRLPVFFLLVVVTALAILPNRVAAWVRTGVCGMVAGGITFGLVWLYLGSDASQLGALLAAVGSVLLVAGGIIAVAPGRSGEPPHDA